MSESEEQKYKSVHTLSLTNQSYSPGLTHVRAKIENDDKSCAILQGDNQSVVGRIGNLNQALLVLNLSTVTDLYPWA